jgi:hypothetical protein
MPELAEEGALADLRALHPQPAPAQLVRADHRVVGQERTSPTVVRLGSSSTVDASTSLPTRAPSSRSQTGVSRLE